LKSFSELPKGSGMLEIDVNTNDGRKVLEYMCYLLNYHITEDDSQSTISFLVKSADGELNDGLGDFLITRDGIFGIGNLYSPQLTEESRINFLTDYHNDLRQVQFTEYYVSDVNPVIAGQVVDMQTRDYIDLINEKWNHIWGSGTVLLDYNSLEEYVIPKIFPYLYLHCGNRYH